MRVPVPARLLVLLDVFVRRFAERHPRIVGDGVHPAVVRRVESRCAEPCGFGKRLVQLRFEILFQLRVAAGQFDPVAQIVEYAW